VWPDRFFSHGAYRLEISAVEENFPIDRRRVRLPRETSFNTGKRCLLYVLQIKANLLSIKGVHVIDISSNET